MAKPSSKGLDRQQVEIATQPVGEGAQHSQRPDGVPSG
jgi:hypothetical protein